MEMITFPFIVDLGKTFQTDNNLYYLCQYVAGENFY